MHHVQVHREGPPVVGPNPLPELIHIGIAMESSSYLDDDFFAFAVLNSLMGGGGSFSAGGPGKGMYTHLYRDVLSRHHWVYWAMAQNHAYADSGIFCLFGSCHPSKVNKEGEREGGVMEIRVCVHIYLKLIRVFIALLCFLLGS